MSSLKATLILENGSVLSGTSIGSTETRVCELVFNTSMTGYQEILTDPSYAGQGVVMSYPLIGNYGVNSEDNESSRPWVEMLVVRHLSPRGSNFRREMDLGDYMKEHDIPGIEGVDTRALTKMLRSQGSMNAMLTCAQQFDVGQVLERLHAYKVRDTIQKVTRSAPEEFSRHRGGAVPCGHDGLRSQAEYDRLSPPPGMQRHGAARLHPGRDSPLRRL